MCMKNILTTLLIILFTGLTSFASSGYDSKNVHTQTMCSNSSPCIRTGFSRPRTRFSQPNKRFSQPKTGLAHPKVLCNETYGQPKYYKTGMKQKYKKNIIQTETPISRFDKNYTIAQNKKTTCNGITYYNLKNMCK